MRKQNVFGMVSTILVCAASAAEQVWSGGNNGVWDLATPNWDSGTVWVNGNTARFTSADTVAIDGAVEAAGLTFDADGAAIGGTGTLTLTDSATVSTAAGGTNEIRTVLAGSAGLTKTGDGTLTLAATNLYTGVTVVSTGILRMATNYPAALGATGTGNGTVVMDGAALDINGAFLSSSAGGVNNAEALTLSGAGPEGLGALRNTGSGSSNTGFSGGFTLTGDTTINCVNRIDIRCDVTGNGHTLTKIGNGELAVGNYSVGNCPVIIGAGMYTYMGNNALGGTEFETTLNGGTLRSYGGPFTCNETLICNAGTIIAAGLSANTYTFALTGRVKFNGNISARGESAPHTVDFAGPLEGTGILTRSSGGNVVITGDDNDGWTGALVVASDLSLCLGRTNETHGTFGSCTVTNNGNVYIDRAGAFVSRAGFYGGGRLSVRYGGEMIAADCVSSNYSVYIGQGALTLSNNVDWTVYNQLNIADRNAGWPNDPSNIVARLNILPGASLTANYIAGGNGSGGSMTGIVTQTGGRVRTTGQTGASTIYPEEQDGLHLGHYPTGYTEWNISGGEVIVDNGYRLAIAIDGRGVWHQTGGEVSASEVILNGRNNVNGHGRLTLEGGVINVGSNGITAGTGAPYILEYGGGTVRASTNFASSLNATLLGTGADSVTFDTAEWAIALSGNLTGTGGLSKAGAGTLTLSGNNAYSGATRVLAGNLVRAVPAALPLGNVVEFGVAADDSGGRIHADGNLSLAGLVAGVANPGALDKKKQYTIATWGGVLLNDFDGESLPAPWYVGADFVNKRLLLRADIGTVILFK